MSTEETNQTNSISQSQILLFALLIGSFILAYFPVWKSLVIVWSTSDDYSHGFFIIPLCIYIVWLKKEALTTIPTQPSRWGLALVLFSLLFYLLAHFAEIMTLSSFSMVILLTGVVVYIYGFRVLKEILFPLFLLLFMIPVPAQIYATLTIPLQLFVSKSSVGLASLLGLPVYREGNIIHLPEHTLYVVQACSGLRSMISLLTLGAVFGFFTLKSNILRTVLFLSGAPAAIVVNIFRVVMMILVFHYFNYDLTKGGFHTAFGVFIFIFALFIIAATRKMLSVWDKPAI